VSSVRWAVGQLQRRTPCKAPGLCLGA
jgi:hypothetical protein